jgi:hypothetical protein
MQVPSAIFCDFVKCVKGKSIQIIEADFIFVRALNKEFGFDTLSTECESFTELYANSCNSLISLLKSVLIVCLCEIDKSQVSFE